MTALTAKAATLGEISESEQWVQVLSALGVPHCQFASFVEAFLAGARMDAELLAFIRGLRPRYRTGLLSNAWSDARHWVDSLYGGLDAFDVSVFSAEAGLAKPNPAIYYLILERLSVSASEAVFVDDIPQNVEAAESLGLHAIRFQNTQQVQKAILALLGSAAD